MLKHGLSVLRPSLVLLFLSLAPVLHPAGVTVRFDPAAPETGPFPTDFLTASDSSQLTGLRVNLPLPACGAPPATCPEYALLNTLDGFSLHPRLRVRFSSPINPDTLRAGIYLVWLDRFDASGSGLFPAGHRTRINQVVYDPATQTAYAVPDETLEQHRRYTLIVTAAIRDTTGDPVEPEAAFLACRAASLDGSYCGRLASALNNLPPSVPARARARAEAAPVVAASLFSTLSASTWLEQARAALPATPLNVERAAPLAVFPVGLLSSFTLRQQTGVNPSKFTDFTVPFPGLLLAGVGRVAFGSFTSPSFLDSRRVVPPSPSGAPVVPAAASERIQFHVFLPSSAPPPGGYPVVIFGHGLDDSSFGGPTLVASTLARNGFAMVAINAVGHGTGPESRVLLTVSGTTVDLPAGGRGLDLNNDGVIESKEGCLISGAVPVGLRDCIRQTVLDLVQLVRVLRAGVDLDGDGVVDLDPGHIYYGGQSFGALLGTVFTALEPAVRTAVLNVGGGSVVDVGRWSQEFHSIPRSGGK